MGMKAASDSNELVFTLRVAPHTRNAGDLKSFGDMVIKEQKRIHDASSSIRGSKSGITNFGFPDEKELAKASAAQLRHQQRQAEAQKKALDKEAENVRKAAAEKAAAEKKAADDAIKEADREAAEVEREQDRQHHRHRQRQLERARRNRTSLEESVANAKAEGAAQGKLLADANSKAMAMHERARTQLVNAQEGIRSEFAKTGHGVLQLGHGLALLGLVGEKDAEKFLSALAKVEGIFQIAKGGLDIYQGLASGARKYREAVLQAAVAEHALAKARAASAASNGLGGLGGSAIKGGSSLSSAGAMASGGGGGLAGVGSLASAGPAAAAIAAIVAVGAAFKELSEIADGTAGEVESLTSRIGRFEEWVLSFIREDIRPDPTGGVYTNAYNSEQRRKSQEKYNTSDMANRARGRGEQDLASSQRLRLMDFENRGQSGLRELEGLAGPANDHERQRTLRANQSMQDENTAASLRGEASRATTDQQRNAAMQALIAIEERRTQAILEDAKLEKDIAKTKIDAAKESMNSLREQRQIQQDIIKEEGDRLKSAAERFADLDDEKRNQLLSVKTRLDQAAAADASQAPWDRGKGEKIRSGITKEERDLAKSVGLRDLDQGAQKAALEDARRKGFDRFAAGSSEVQRIRNAQSETQKIEAAFKVQQEIAVKVELDSKEVIRQAVDLFNQQLAIQRQAIRQEFQNEIDQSALERARSTDQRLIATDRSRR